MKAREEDGAPAAVLFAFGPIPVLGYLLDLAWAARLAAALAYERQRRCRVCDEATLQAVALADFSEIIGHVATAPRACLQK
jgi:hypothetical protein